MWENHQGWIPGNFLELRQTDGAERAYTALVRHYAKTIYFHIRHLLFDHSQTDDLVQETFLKVWKNIHSFRGPGSIEGWLRRIATNEVLQHLRKTRTRISTVSNGMEDRDGVAHIEPQAPDYWNAEEGEKRFLQAIEHLPEKQRLVFSMKYFGDITYAEMAEQLGGTVGSLKASYHHAVQKLKNKLSTD